MFNNLNYMCANLLCINNDGVAPYLTRPSKLRLLIIGLFLFLLLSFSFFDYLFLFFFFFYPFVCYLISYYFIF